LEHVLDTFLGKKLGVHVLKKSEKFGEGGRVLFSLLIETIL